MTHQMTFTETCVHHWVIESPDGRNVSPAVCKKCGADDEFKNWFDPDKKVWGKTTKGRKRDA